MPQRHRAQRGPWAHPFRTLLRGCKCFSCLGMLNQPLSWESRVCTIPISISPCQFPTGSSVGKHFPANFPAEVPANGFCWALDTALKPFPGAKHRVRFVNTRQSRGADGRQEFFHRSVQHLDRAPGFPCHQDLGVKNTTSHAL